jgi:phosphoribosyl 1,2-cyclic phosphodiesterase
VRITVLASGSSGNATLLESGGTRILVDAGIGSRTLALALRDTGAGGPPHAIIVTHAHHDHVGRCARISRKLRIPVHATEATDRTANLGGDVRTVGTRTAFTIGSMTIFPLPVPHDAAQVALVVDGGSHRVAIATDLGEVTADLRHHIEHCDVLLLESNHDPELLERGPYPATLKRRIGSARGHLSNAQACELLRTVGRRTRHVVLMHLSETNNRPELALGAARDALRWPGVDLRVADRKSPVVVELDGVGRGTQLALPGTCW